MRRICTFLFGAFALLAGGAFFAAALGHARPQKDAAELKTRNVVLIVLDGLRWQEVFRGAERDLMDPKTGGVQDPEGLKKQFWNEAPGKRREALMPFLWAVVAKQGQIFGNRDKRSTARVTNGYNFSYPGYNEMLTGHPDSRIDKNGYGANPNVTVFEWLDRMPDFHGRVAVFGTWDVFPDIFNVKRSGLFVRAGWEVPWPEPLSPREALLKKLYATTTRVEGDDVPDSFTHEDLLDRLDALRPRVLFVGYGETDDWAHDGRYDLLLQAARAADARIAELWSRMQEMDEYRGKTTFLITADHGRGSGLKEWKNHDRNVEGAEYIWLAAIGPDTPALGEMQDFPEVTQSQIATTIAGLVGEDYRSAFPRAALPLPVAPFPAALKMPR